MNNNQEVTAETGGGGGGATYGDNNRDMQNKHKIPAISTTENSRTDDSISDPDQGLSDSDIEDIDELDQTEAATTERADSRKTELSSHYTSTTAIADTTADEVDSSLSKSPPIGDAMPAPKRKTSKRQNETDSAIQKRIGSTGIAATKPGAVAVQPGAYHSSRPLSGEEAKMRLAAGVGVTSVRGNGRTKTDPTQRVRKSQQDKQMVDTEEPDAHKVSGFGANGPTTTRSGISDSTRSKRGTYSKTVSSSRLENDNAKSGVYTQPKGSLSGASTDRARTGRDGKLTDSAAKKPPADVLSTSRSSLYQNDGEENLEINSDNKDDLRATVASRPGAAVVYGTTETYSSKENDKESQVDMAARTEKTSPPLKVQPKRIPSTSRDTTDRKPAASSAVSVGGSLSDADIKANMRGNPDVGVRKVVQSPAELGREFDKIQQYLDEQQGRKSDKSTTEESNKKEAEKLGKKVLKPPLLLGPTGKQPDGTKDGIDQQFGEVQRHASAVNDQSLDTTPPAIENPTGNPHVWPAGRTGARRHKSEIGLLPGQVIPGAYEAEWSLRPHWGNGQTPNYDNHNGYPSAVNTPSTAHRDVSDAPGAVVATVDPLDTFLVSDTSPPRRMESRGDGQSEHAPGEEQGAFAGGSAASTYPVRPEFMEQRRKKQVRELSFCCMVVVVLGIVAGIVAFFLIRDANRKKQRCYFGGKSEPSVFLQCECQGSVDILTSATKDTYYGLIEEVYEASGVEVDLDDISSCSDQNLALLAASSPATRYAADSPRDRYLLSSVYLQTTGERWSSNKNWYNQSSASVSMCDWHGIGCAFTSSGINRVAVINLQDNGLAGPLPIEFMLFDELRESTLPTRVID